jgi:predicted DNA-binding transcriptional regulator AlpA
MSSSPAHPISAVGPADDVFERLARCDRLLTAKELGDILAISPKTLYNYVTRGMIPYFKIESNVRFRAREVAEWDTSSLMAPPRAVCVIAMNAVALHKVAKV